MASLIGEVTDFDRETITQQNLEYMRVRVNVPIHQPLIPGVFLRLEQGGLAWIQFGYERVFKLCYKCGCIGHQEYRCPSSFEQARANIRHRIHVARPAPNNDFWLSEGISLYVRGIKAYSNSNLNRTSRITILCSEDAQEDDIFEIVNSVGSRLTFFVLHAEFDAFDDDPTEPSNDDDDDHSHASDHIVTEPLNQVLGEDDAVDSGVGLSKAIQEGQSLWNAETNRSGLSRLGLDESFERALNALGLTSDEDNVGPTNKRAGIEMAGPSTKKPRVSSLDFNIDLNENNSLEGLQVANNPEVNEVGDELLVGDLNTVNGVNLKLSCRYIFWWSSL
ncbi:hypothetical protein Vadar_001504 [Vaccinium darrowii]|uniref:Uncharacterized protein n=1 Tax=Vaccinium darrowii TaxID=229202 RepID=A0ACB7YB29_9ERIC|nr:hypothetical protein Vadar_001504 [Vaccinium darrowii]